MLLLSVLLIDMIFLCWNCCGDFMRTPKMNEVFRPKGKLRFDYDSYWCYFTYALHNSVRKHGDSTTLLQSFTCGLVWNELQPSRLGMSESSLLEQTYSPRQTMMIVPRTLITHQSQLAGKLS